MVGKDALIDINIMKPIIFLNVNGVILNSYIMKKMIDYYYVR